MENNCGPWRSKLFNNPGGPQLFFDKIKMAVLVVVVDAYGDFSCQMCFYSTWRRGSFFVKFGTLTNSMMPISNMKSIFRNIGSKFLFRGFLVPKLKSAPYRMKFGTLNNSMTPNSNMKSIFWNFFNMTCFRPFCKKIEKIFPSGGFELVTTRLRNRRLTDCATEVWYLSRVEEDCKVKSLSSRQKKIWNLFLEILTIITCSRAKNKECFYLNKFWHID